jgi:hypothetical protein
MRWKETLDGTPMSAGCTEASDEDDCWEWRRRRWDCLDHMYLITIDLDVSAGEGGHGAVEQSQTNSWRLKDRNVVLGTGIRGTE